VVEEAPPALLETSAAGTRGGPLGLVSVGSVPWVVVGGRARTSPTLAVKDASHRCAAAFGRP